MDFYNYKIIQNCTVKIQAIHESIKIIPKIILSFLPLNGTHCQCWSVE